MSDPFFRIEIGPDHFMCISPLDEDILEAAAVDGLGDEFGFFVYETIGSRRDAIEVLAKCPTYETAVRLLEFLRPAASAERARALPALNPSALLAILPMSGERQSLDN